MSKGGKNSWDVTPERIDPFEGRGGFERHVQMQGPRRNSRNAYWKAKHFF